MRKTFEVFFNDGNIYINKERLVVIMRNMDRFIFVKETCSNLCCEDCPCEKICSQEKVFVTPNLLYDSCIETKDGLIYINKLYEEFKKTGYLYK